MRVVSYQWNRQKRIMGWSAKKNNNNKDIWFYSIFFVCIFYLHAAFYMNIIHTHTHSYARNRAVHITICTIPLCKHCNYRTTVRWFVHYLLFIFTSVPLFFPLSLSLSITLCFCFYHLERRACVRFISKSKSNIFITMCFFFQ